MWVKIIIFLVLNFAALALGGIFTSSGVASDWYQHINKAPWTPPGWVFGFAWTSIMICFALFMAFAWGSEIDTKLLLALFIIQWILNIAWNPVFFYYKNVLGGLIIISLLTILVAYFFIGFMPQMKYKT
jgi:translocator protein